MAWPAVWTSGCGAGCRKPFSLCRGRALLERGVKVLYVSGTHQPDAHSTENLLTVNTVTQFT